MACLPSTARADDTAAETPASLPIGADGQFRARMLDWSENAPAEAPQRSESMVPVARPQITSGFGMRTDPLHGGRARHAGVDLAAAPGEPVHASAAGYIGVAATAGGYGKLVTIRHADGLESRYAHLSRILVMPGQRVQAGQVIGQAGSTGRSTGSHLHYEVRRSGLPVDPIAGGQSVEAAQPHRPGAPLLSTFARAQK
ncbi:hypothetical protein ACFB49_27880 [Sphingomonas sp. DBB INV C78]|uniref:M23 family metallopeptidase n=1 Tax=Sphingomonas sp. DBB INV C78 TaxID=3349434 RepID=UPI0036D37DDF